MSPRRATPIASCPPPWIFDGNSTRCLDLPSISATAVVSFMAPTNARHPRSAIVRLLPDALISQFALVARDTVQIAAQAIGLDRLNEKLMLNTQRRNYRAATNELRLRKGRSKRSSDANAGLAIQRPGRTLGHAVANPRIRAQATGEVRPNARENNQIRPSAAVRGVRDYGGHPCHQPVLSERGKSGNIHAGSGFIWRIPDESAFRSIESGREVSACLPSN
jgi:hypothetical protein